MDFWTGFIAGLLVLGGISALAALRTLKHVDSDNDQRFLIGIGTAVLAVLGIGVVAFTWMVLT